MKKVGKILGYLILFIATGTLFTFLSLTVVDDYIYSLSQTSAVASTYVSSNNTKESIMSNSVTLEEDITNLQFAYNNKYFAYLKDDKVHIKNADGSDYDIIEEEEQICYFNLLYDKNLIVYITSEETSSTNTRLVINKYDIETKRKVVYNKFYVQNFSRIKEMNMSPIINIIYINVETKSLTYTNNTIYTIDLFNTLYIVKSGKIYDRMIMLQTKDIVYYEDTNSNIYSSKKGLLSLFKTKVELIGIDLDDNLYFMQKDTKSIVYKVKNDKIVDTIKLSDSDVVTTYTNNFNTYVVYPTYVINVSAKDPYKRIARFTNFVEFLGIKDVVMYLKPNDGKLVTTNVLESEEAESTGEVESYVAPTQTTTTTNNSTTNKDTNNNTASAETTKNDTSKENTATTENNSGDKTNDNKENMS